MPNVGAIALAELRLGGPKRAGPRRHSVDVGCPVARSNAAARPDGAVMHTAVDVSHAIDGAPLPRKRSMMRIVSVRTASVPSPLLPVAVPTTTTPDGSGRHVVGVTNPDESGMLRQSERGEDVCAEAPDEEAFTGVGCQAVARRQPVPRIAVRLRDAVMR